MQCYPLSSHWCPFQNPGPHVPNPKPKTAKQGGGGGGADEEERLSVQEELEAQKELVEDLRKQRSAPLFLLLIYYSLLDVGEEGFSQRSAVSHGNIYLQTYLPPPPRSTMPDELVDRKRMLLVSHDASITASTRVCTLQAHTVAMVDDSLARAGHH